MSTPDEFGSFAREHLLYEVWMLRGLTDRLLEVLEHDERVGKRDLDWLDMVTRNALVEAFTIHARLLIHFLYEPSHVKPDDALARHYVPEGEWTPPELTGELERVGRRVGKGVAHLTYDRLLVTEETKGWRYGKIWEDIATALRAFAERASSELLPADVAERIGELTAPGSHDSETVSRATSVTDTELTVATYSTASPSQSLDW
jgi:hypothetical protein